MGWGAAVHHFADRRLESFEGALLRREMTVRLRGDFPQPGLGRLDQVRTQDDKHALRPEQERGEVAAGFAHDFMIPVYSLTQSRWPYRARQAVRVSRTFPGGISFGKSRFTN